MRLFLRVFIVALAIISAIVAVLFAVGSRAPATPVPPTEVAMVLVTVTMPPEQTTGVIELISPTEAVGVASEQEAPTQAPGGGSWACPGEAVENGGCLVSQTTDVPERACVDYDPRGGDHPVGSYATIDTEETRQRVEFRTPGEIVLSGGRATIYTNNYCPTF